MSHHFPDGIAWHEVVALNATLGNFKGHIVSLETATEHNYIMTHFRAIIANSTGIFLNAHVIASMYIN